MSDLREALEAYDCGLRSPKHTADLAAAARRFLALTETGLLHEFINEWEYAHAESCTNMLTDNGECSKETCHHEKPQSLRLLADYLTEEET